MIAILFGTVLPWLLIAVTSWLGYQLVRQNGRILLRLDSIDRRLARRSAPKPRKEANGLPIGTDAPDFELPDLTGARKSLADFRGKNILLMFFNPQCGFCVRMADDLKRLTRAVAEKVEGEWTVPVIITTGNRNDNLRFFREHGIPCTVLLQEQMQIASKYQVNGTPMGYHIDVNGKIASEVAVGADALLQFAGSVVLPAAKRTPANGSAKKYKPDPSLAKSRINRDGLRTGTLAPEFTLPRIDGGELSLATFRGARVLLVFSDPDCGPCDGLAPYLQALHEERQDLQVIVVSRRDAEATRTKAEKLGLTYPIVMQKQWEISLKYAMFATPIGYLIDEHGTVEHNVAIGVESILALANACIGERDDELSRSKWRMLAPIEQ